VPALIVDPGENERLARSPRRAAFYAGAVASLAAALRERGVRLQCRRGRLPATARALARDTGAETVVWAAAYDAAARERRRELQSALEEAGLRALEVHDAPAVHPEATAAARSAEGGLGYRAFAPFAAVWETLERAPVATNPAFADVEAKADLLPTPAEGGAEPPSEARALGRLDAFLAGPVLQYSAARNVPGTDGTSRLSADLSFGTIAARTVLARIDARLRDAFLLTEERLALRAFARALTRRDFFLQLAWFFEERPDEPLQARMRGFPWRASHPHFAAWCEGRTGYPLVDAGMRELRATGWMHPRARLAAASFACFDLGLDWRVGRDAWERMLAEDEPACASGNWQWIAGIGADLAQFPRIYNPRKQLRAYDPRGVYVRRWIPELANVADAELFGPVPSGRPQLALPLFAPEYPAPLLDHEQAARDFLRRYGAYVKRAADAGDSRARRANR
jgi:deoxyribodipyrimidine photo-lyase